MTVIDALHGRARVKTAEQRCRRVLVVLLLALAVLQLEKLVRIDVAQAARGTIPYAILPFYVWIRFAGLALYALGYALGGVLVDAFGLRRVVGVSLIGWCAVTVVGTQAGSVAYQLVGALATDLLPGIVFTAALATVRRMMAPRRRGPAIAVLLLAFDYAWSSYNPFDEFDLLFGSLPADDPTAWLYPMFALASAGALIAVVWLLAVPESDPAAGLGSRRSAGRSFETALRDAVRIAGQPMVWGLAAIQFCSTFVLYYALDQTWTFMMLRQGAVQRPVVDTIVTVPIATLVFAVWSDWAFRRTRSFLTARRPFVVLGFLVGGLAPSLAVAMASNVVAWTIAAAVGLAAMRLTNLVMVDAAPRETAATYVGVVMTGALSAQIALQTLQSMGSLYHPWLQTLVMPIALAGAVLSAMLLPRLRLPTDRATNDSLARHF